MTTFYEFQERYPDDEACLQHIMETRYGGTELDCPKCDEHGKFYRMTRERAYVCQHCKFQLFPMHRKRRWNAPARRSTSGFMPCTCSPRPVTAVAAKELERQLGVTYKCAWRMAHEIRKYMERVDGEIPLGGIVEVDETYIGGKKSGGKRGPGCSGQDRGIRNVGAERRCHD